MNSSLEIELHEHLPLHQNGKEIPSVCSYPVSQFNVLSVALMFHFINQITLMVDLKTSKKRICGGLGLVWWGFSPFCFICI